MSSPRILQKSKTTRITPNMKYAAQKEAAGEIGTGGLPTEEAHPPIRVSLYASVFSSFSFQKCGITFERSICSFERVVLSNARVERFVYKRQKERECYKNVLN